MASKKTLLILYFDLSKFKKHEENKSEILVRNTSAGKSTFRTQENTDSLAR